MGEGYSTTEGPNRPKPLYCGQFIDKQVRTMSGTTPHALLFTSPGCPHCPGVKAALEILRDEGVIAGLETVSIVDDPARAESLGIRSVPWLQLGEFILTGAQTPQQLRQWAERAASGSIDDYLHHLLSNGELATAENLLAQSPQYLPFLLQLLQSTDAPIQVRMGVSAIIEELEGSPLLQGLLPTLIEMSRHDDHRLRSDACHFLGLTHNPAALPPLQARLDDSNDEVREIASESLELIQSQSASRQ
jgi:hypothetical protein